MKTAFLFPGQGSQHVGMGKDLAETYSEAAEIFAAANDIVGYDLRGICFEGPAEKLNTTAISQPAIFVTSAAFLEVMQSATVIKSDITAGLSLGEYSALYAAGILSFEDGLKLVQKRGQAMQEASESSDGAMVSILGLDETKVSELCEKAGEAEVLDAVNFNCPGQIVISGSKGACERAAAMAESFGAIKAIALPVAGAFHTELMSTAAEQLAEALQLCQVNEPGQVKTIANIDAEYYDSAEKIRSGLKKQLTWPILWQKCMERLLADGVEKMYEIGPGRVLTGLMRRINRKFKVENLSSAESAAKLLESSI